MKSTGRLGRSHVVRGAASAAPFVVSIAALAAALAGGCGAAPPAAPTGPAPTAVAAPAPKPAPAPAAEKPAPAAAFDPCEGSPPVPKEYTGILRVARCEQDMFLTMAGVADMLGVKCGHCHVPHPTDPKKEDYPVMTPKKEVANWMSKHFMPALKQVDGQAMKCKSCHTDGQGKPVAKILGNPRDPVKAQEWMSLVMVNKFVTAGGEKLKCKSCHAGNFTTAQWKAKVLLQTEQIPAH